MNKIHLTRRQVLAGGLAAASALACPALARSASPALAIGGPAFGTSWKAVLSAAANAGVLQTALQETLARIDRLMSPWRRDSAITAFNERRSRDWQPIDSEIATVVRAALSVRGASERAFDIAVGPHVGRWGFGPIAAAAVPQDAEILASDSALCKSHPEVTVDLCGIAKGYALDQMVSVLREHGEENFIVDLGGEVVALGHHPNGRSWQIAVEDPRHGHVRSAEIIALAGRAIATSGDKVNGYTLGGRRYSHIIDPTTEEPVEGAAASVSVIADNAMLADGWATALVSAGVKGPALAQRNGLDALFLFNEEASLRRVAVGRFDEHLA